MTYSLYQRPVFFALLGESCLTLLIYVLVRKTMGQGLALAMATLLLVLGSWWASRYLARRSLSLSQAESEASDRKDVPDENGQAYGDWRNKTERFIATTMKESDRLTKLTDNHQQRASETTSAAARVTESSTMIAGAVEEMNGAIQEINRQADEAAALTETAVDKVRGADQSVETLTGHTDQIVSVV